MSGVGPVEPGEGTWAAENPPPPHRRGPAGPWAPHTARHRRTLTAVLALSAVGAGAFWLYATRPRPDPGPWPAQVVSVSYEGATGALGRTDGTLRFSVLVTTGQGPPVTVESIRQPSGALGLTASPSPPFAVKAGSARSVSIVIKVGDCGMAPRNAALPFLDVTLRNLRAKQDQSFILGDRYARDLARVVTDYCEQPPRLS
ncbi:Tat pathway signal sequence domain protein [Streptomyces sp. NPDC057445]|uniref:Tat pathway signal sequence domain protein n=1 Tax=Streptomyces sp. NPDC057445 TaxID=3346136 RepID=UPI00367920B8